MGGVFVICGAVAEGAGDGGGVAGVFEAEDAVVGGGVDAFHGAGVDAEECGGGHELAECDVGLAVVPGVAGVGGEGLDEAFDDVLVGGEVFSGDALGCGEAGDPLGDVFGGEGGAGGEDDEV